MKTSTTSYFIRFLLFFITINAQTQELELLHPLKSLSPQKIIQKEKTYSNKTNPLSFLDLEKVIPVPNKGFVLFKSDIPEQPNLLELSFYDLKMQKVNTKKIPTTRTNELFTVEQTFIWNNSFILLAAVHHPGPEKNHLLYYQYSLPEFELEKSTIVLETKAPSDVYVPYFSKLSPDKSKLLLVGWNYKKPKENANFIIKIIDQKGVEFRSQLCSFSFQNRRVAIENVFVDNQANVFITGNNYRGELFDDTKPKFLDHFTVGLFTDQTSKVWSIKNGKKYFPSMRYALTTQGNLIGIGFLPKDGFGYFKIDISTRSLISKEIRFAKEVVETAYAKIAPNLKVPNHNFKEYEFRKLLVKDRAIYIIGEQAPYQNYSRTLEDILVVKLDIEGNLKWLTKLPKRQNIDGVSTIYASFAFLETSNKFYFVYNDMHENYKNENFKKLKMADVLTSLSSIIPAVAEVYLDSGAVKRRPLKNIMDNGYLFLPQYCQTISKNDALIIGISTSTEKSGSFSLKNIKIKD